MTALETASRLLCECRGIDPDLKTELIGDRLGPVDSPTVYVEAWKSATAEILRFRQLLDAVAYTVANPDT